MALREEQFGISGASQAQAAQTSFGQPRRRPPKLYRIGEIVDYCGVSRQTIHNYTTMGLITESRRSGGGHRLYGEEVFTRLDLIARMKGRRKSMREIQRQCLRLDRSS
jgi:predicted transcriptional regulator